MIYVFTVLAFVFTFLGGLFAIKFKDKLHLISGFSAGAILGLAFFDLIPEAMEIAKERFDISEVAVVFAIAFIVYMIIDRFFLHHTHENSEGMCKNESHGHQIKRPAFLGVSSLALHSLFDGIAIGLSFQISNALGLAVGLAVLAHDFSDGINTVNFVLKNEGYKKNVLYRWLFIDAIAPVIGIFLGSMILVSDPIMGIIIAVFAGFFTYLGASELLPESYHNHPTWWTTFATILGMAVIYLVVHLAEV